MALPGGAGGAKAGSNGLVALIVIGVLVGVAFLIPGGEEDAFEPMSSPARPVKLIVPSLDLRATVLPIEVNQDNVLDPPSDVSEVGWWKRSVRPGAESGQTVLTGHTVHTGGGVMDRLGTLEPGNAVRVETANGTMVYRTTKVITLTKAQLAKRSTALFGQERASNRLVLVTCTGWTGKDYTSNIIVFAEPLGVRTKKDESEKSAA